jgi:uncharacterized protein (DUF2235 family)
MTDNSSKAAKPAKTPRPAPKPAAAPRPAEPAAATKSIILFSDGTGNSSAKLFKTNVWRLYEALDLGPPTAGRPFVQIAYYDNGVGTSQFRPLALLGGVFGIGLKRNILAIYRFLCRNYKPGDRIYAFGFSRGAFTIRLLVGMIAQQGVVEYKDEHQLAYHARDAYREFCRSQWPNRWPAKMFAHGLRFVRDMLLYVKRIVSCEILYRDIKKYPTDIEFVGVWDTVAAYGGPSVEIVRGIDDWIWPLTMANFELSPKIVKARHALCLDDRRDAFQPLLWDEVREKDVVANGREVAVSLDEEGKPVFAIKKAAPDRLEQVWFTGMHADVGGGYPDETLSYVSLAWMIGETDLHLLDLHKGRIEKMANDFGPVHNSRAGLASYYRYQPRRIEAMLDPPNCWRDRILRDPEIKRDGFPDHGLLTEVKIHKSVIARIGDGTDGYAPINLPPNYVVHPTDPAMRPKEGADAAAAAVQRPGSVLAWARVWDLVWWRRCFYFLTTLTTLWLFAMPLWADSAERITICEDARCWGRSAFGLVDYFVPSFARYWTSAFSAHFSWTLLLVAIIGLFWIIGAWLEGKTSDAARRIWTGTAVNPTRRSVLQVIRESRIYQYLGFGTKWYVLPLGAATLTLAFLALVLASLLGQSQLFMAEKGIWPTRPLCRQEAAHRDPGGMIREQPMAIRDMCTSLRVGVLQGTRYVIYLRVTENWRDNGHPIAPDGRAEGALTEEHGDPMPSYVGLFAPLRRVITQRWLQPLIAIRPPAGDGNGAYLDSLNVEHVGGGLYRAEFTAARDGNLYAFVNDAVLPGAFSHFYNNNSGSACVSLAQAGIELDHPKPGGPCGLAPKQARVAAADAASPGPPAPPSAARRPPAHR